MAFVDKYSQMAIRESTDMSATSEDDELDDPGNDTLNFVGTLVGIASFNQTLGLMIMRTTRNLQ